MERENLPCQTTTTISLVPQHDATEEWDGSLVSLLPMLDFLIMNELEADCITRRQQRDSNDSKDAIQDWASFFAVASPDTYIIITRGAQGAVALHCGNVVAMQSAAKVQVVDPTGAGDAFAAGFLQGLWKWRQTSSSLTNNWPAEAIQQGLYWGCSVASCSVLTRGASVPSPPEQIREFLENTAQH
jgi:sugar/nucleoside kinase (ribokinase family)